LVSKIKRPYSSR